ncbi:hypothetical protein PHMEG_00035292 [Phytophthora megakarya]|uniref:DDE-1 domain-containing protein n=1 Tax=Phytophthora megakarya TaxID=4795 RepID=A0A225URR8_9STRA|nr:hypothetical protein PHMEG_00035292 [Phytophthora megakarya]
MYNMDQISIYIDMNRNTTITFTVDDGTYLSRLRVLCASATGNKLLPMIVFAGVPQADVHQELLNYPLHPKRRRLLLLGSLKTHKMGSVRVKLEEDYCTEVEFVSPGITDLSQPMNVSVMRAFKSRCTRLYVKHHLMHAFPTTTTERRFSITQIVMLAWESIDDSLLLEDFYKLGCYQLDHENQMVSLELSYMLTSMKKRTSR